MAVVVAGGSARAEQAARLQWWEQEQRSLEMAAPPRPPRPRPARAAVVYYLSRNGHLEHPHFIEVALTGPDGLCLRDVIDRLDALRGKGMARMYSWASKRCYRNGFVWHDLADDDYIRPVVGREYVLKGTERLHPAPLPLLDAAAASSSSSEAATSSSSGGRWEHGRPTHRKKEARACDAAELGQYMVHKGEDRAADAATQTEDGGRGHQGRVGRATTPAHVELSRAETSPPTASTSPEALIKADGRLVAAVNGAGRARVSSVLMQLISCGSVSVKDAHASLLIPRARPPRPPASASVAAIPSYSVKIVEDKEPFSGSIVEMTKSPAADDACQDLVTLRRSSSYNTDRVVKAGAGKGGRPGDLHDRCKDGGDLVIPSNGQGDDNKR